jgi:hypothetical protein
MVEIDEEELDDDSTEKVRSFTTVVKSDNQDNDQSDPSTEVETEEAEEEDQETEDDTVTEETAKGINKNKTKLKAVPKKDENIDEATLNRYTPKLAETLQTVQGGTNVSAQEMQMILKTSPNALKLMRKVADSHAYNMETYGSANQIEINGKRYRRQEITTKLWREAKRIEASSDSVTDPVEKVDAEIDTFNKRLKIYWGIPNDVAENMNFTFAKTLVTAVEYSILNSFH